MLTNTITDALSAAGLGLVLFAALLILRAEFPLLVGLPIGIAAVWFLAQTARRSRHHREEQG